MKEYLGHVRIEKEAKSDRPARRDESFGRNPHARDNVNVAQGPRTGNATAHDGKRSKFKEVKTMAFNAGLQDKSIIMKT